MTKKNNTQAVNAQADAFTQAEIDAEKAILALAAAGLSHYVDAAIMAAGLAITQAEHDEARPLSAIDKAKAALAAIGVDIMTLEADKATAGNLSLSLDTLAKAAGKYGRYAVVYDADNGTSCVSHYMLKTLAECGRVTLADTLAFARKTLPSYSSAGHYNTMKRLFKAAGYRVNVAQGSFSLSV